MPRHLLLVDDDELSREVLALLAHEAGFTATLFSSGEAALAHLACPHTTPSALLIDFQLPTLAGDPLALRLRAAVPPATLLIAMSGSPVPPTLRRQFDTFLLKPFTYQAFLATVTDSPTPPEPPPITETPILSEATYQALAQSMSSEQLHNLYNMLLDDADRRILLMRQAILTQDADAYTRAAHAIKGGCGMVGALELAAIAADMEDFGPPPNHPDTVTNSDPFLQFQAAAARLRSMLEAHP